jgi:hypothetical protein
VRGRILVGVGAWLAGAAAATGFSHLAVSNLASGLGAAPGNLLSNSAVENALANAQRTTPPTASQAPSAGPATPTARASTPAAGGVLLASPGGTVVARCTGDVAYLKSWSPEQGFLVDTAIRGPAASTRVGFESAHRTVTMQISCVAGIARVTMQDKPVGSTWGGEPHDN